MKGKDRNAYLFFSLGFIIIVLVWEWLFLRYNKSHIFNIDGIEQYYATFLYIGIYLRKLLEYLFVNPLLVIHPPAYDLSIAMGEDIIGALNYYGFGSPLNIIAIFATENTGPFLFTIAYYMRLILAGFAFINLLRELNLRDNTSAVGAICYVFTGFAIKGCSQYMEWGSALIYLPLIICGAERIIKKKSFFLFVASVCFGALCGFYYLYMCSLCLMVYVIIRLFFRYKTLSSALYTVIKLCGFYFWGLSLSAVFFVPSLEAYFISERSGSTSIISVLADKENWLPVWDRLEGYYVVFERRELLYGVWILYIVSLLGIIFLLKSNAAKQIFIACIIAIVSASIPLCGWMFNGFGESNLRYAFIVHFTISINVAFCLGTIRNRIRKNGIMLSRIVFSSSLLISIVSAMYCIAYLFSPIGFNGRTEYIAYEDVDKYINTPPCNYSTVIQEDKDLFRISKEKGTGMHNRPENMAMVNGYYGMTYFLSIINQNTQDYVNRNVGERLKWRSYGFENDSKLNSDCGVKYYIGLSNTVPNDYVLVDKVFFNDEYWYVYKNTMYKGFAYFNRSSENSNKTTPVISGISYDNNSNTFICNTSTESDLTVMTVAIPYSKNWIGKIDGHKTIIEKTPDSMFIDILVPRGKHTVKLYYRSISREIGMVISAAAIVMLSIFQMKKHYSHKQQQIIS